MDDIIVEVMDERDKDSEEKWSVFGYYQNLENFHDEWDTFIKYCREYPIIEVRIRKS